MNCESGEYGGVNYAGFCYHGHANNDQLTSTTDVPGGSSVNSILCDCPWLRNVSLITSLDTLGTGTTYVYITESEAKPLVEMYTISKCCFIPHSRLIISKNPLADYILSEFAYISTYVKCKIILVKLAVATKISIQSQLAIYSY